MIHIENDWYIAVEDCCYTLQQYYRTFIDKRDGKEKVEYTNQRYYPTLTAAVLAYYRVKTVEALIDKDLELYDALALVAETNRSIEDKLKEVLRE